MKSFTATSLLAALVALAPAVSAADCYGSARVGSVQDYQNVASSICNGGTNRQIYSNCVRGPAGTTTCNLHEAGFSGTAGKRDQCWNAFNNIISQCVEGSGRNGGEWKWNFNGVTQNYYAQAFSGVRVSKREIEKLRRRGLVIEGPAEAAAATEAKAEA